MQGLECQHGPLECRLNRIFACAIDQSKTQEDYWPFVECVEGAYGDKIEGSLKGCAKDNGFNIKDLEDCASGAETFLWSSFSVLQGDTTCCLMSLTSKGCMTRATL